MEVGSEGGGTKGVEGVEGVSPAVLETSSTVDVAKILSSVQSWCPPLGRKETLSQINFRYSFPPLRIERVSPLSLSSASVSSPPASLDQSNLLSFLAEPCRAPVFSEFLLAPRTSETLPSPTFSSTRLALSLLPSPPLRSNHIIQIKKKITPKQS